MVHRRTAPGPATRPTIVRPRTGADLRRAGARPGAALLRIVAVLTLYAFALQGILGGTASAALGVDHVLCLAGHSADSAGSDGKRLPHEDHRTCCVVCHVAGPGAVPAPPPTPAGPVAHPVAASCPRPRRIANPRAPPGPNPGARAPPVV